MIMDNYFKVSTLDEIFSHISSFSASNTENISIEDSPGRVLADKITCDSDLPGFSRSTMDGYAVPAASTFGASQGSPAWLSVKGTVLMGSLPPFSVGPGEAARISTGGMLPEGTDSVVMVEHTDPVDDQTVEIYKSVAPGQHVVERGEDFKKGATVLLPGTLIRPQETGLLAAFGIPVVKVHKRPRVAIISTGDEVVPISETPAPGFIRDINTYTLSALVRETGAIPVPMGVVKDSAGELKKMLHRAVSETDMVLVSGGSSVGARDYTIEAIEALEDSRLIAHGISISPGKPTILAKAGDKPVWGLPGHVVSAMVVFEIVVKPFLNHLRGLSTLPEPRFVRAVLTRNIPSSQGRTDYIRVKLVKREGELFAEPVLGKSGLINTMIKADGLVEIPLNTEGLDQGSAVMVRPI